MSHAHKNLNHYFEAAKAQEPVVPLSELKEAINQLPASTDGGNPTAGTGAKKTFWAAGGMGAVVFTVLLWMKLAQPSEAPATENQRIHLQETNAPAQVTVVPSGSRQKEVAPPVQSAAQKSVMHLPQATDAPTIKRVQNEGAPKAQEAKKGEKVFGKIALLELPREVEQKLGISVNDRGIMYRRVFQDKDGRHVGLEFTIYSGGHSVNVSTNLKPDADSSQIDAAASNLHPVYVSNRQGEQRVRYMIESENERKLEPSYFAEIVNTLFPVLVRANNKAKDEAIFWYEATPAFLSQLPASVRLKINQEYDFSKFNIVEETKEASSNSVKEQVALKEGTATQMKYFESSQGSLSSVQYAVVFPNPSADWLNLSMSLKRAEEMRVSLVDINGNLVKVLSPFKQYAAGTVTEKFSIKGEASGIYLLLAETKSGHKHTQRIIIE